MQQSSNHTHDCRECGFTWTCEYGNKKPHKKCKVTIGAKVNKDGPFCNLCLHTIMAIRFAAARSIDIAAHVQRLIEREVLHV